MMRDVLISIQPKWCELIASGKKTVEVRKTKPKLETPFKCYIYCTLSGSNEFFREDCNGDIAEWNKSKMALKKGKVIGEFVCDRLIHYEMEGYDKDLDLYQSIKAVRLDEDGDELWFTIATNEMTESELSKVHLLNKSCLSFDDIGSYVVGNKPFGFHQFFGWHISDLVIYDEPKEIGEFFKYCGDNPKCDGCDAFYYSNTECGKEEYCCSVIDGHKPLKRLPQSWCYVKKGGER